MGNSSVIGRTAALAALGVAVIAVAYVLLSSGSSYQVKAIFTDASQIVSGDQVQVGGNAIGTVSNISLTPNGQAALTLSISSSTFDPLHEGTQATIRVASLSGIANRYVDLDLGPANAPAIPNGGEIPTSDTTTAVDLDELFNTLNDPLARACKTSFRAPPHSGPDRARTRSWRGSTSTPRSPRAACCSPSSTRTPASSPASSRPPTIWSPIWLSVRAI